MAMFYRLSLACFMLIVVWKTCPWFPRVTESGYVEHTDKHLGEQIEATTSAVKETVSILQDAGLICSKDGNEEGCQNNVKNNPKAFLKSKESKTVAKKTVSVSQGAGVLYNKDLEEDFENNAKAILQSNFLRTSTVREQADNEESPRGTESKAEENFQADQTDKKITEIFDEKDASKRYCYSEDRTPHRSFAEMTPYNASGGLTASNVVPKGCKPKYIWLVLRPGCYSAHSADMERFKKHLPLIKNAIIRSHSIRNGSLCPKDVALLQGWKPEDLEIGPERSLTPIGKREMKGIANRFKAAFPELLKKPKKIAFAPTRQTRESAQTFGQTLYGRIRGANIIASRKIEFLARCKKHLFDVLMKPKERKIYEVLIQTLNLQGISKRLGVGISYSMVRSMYNACRYQKVLYPANPSPWCVAFTKMEHVMLEHWQDIRALADYGYLSPVAYKAGCFLGKDIMNTFRFADNTSNASSTADETSSPNANFKAYFINTEEFYAFTALFGFFNKSIVANENHANAGDWKTSKFGTFGSNYAFILSSCENNSWWVSVTLNEAPIKLPGCEDPLGCPLEKFKSLYSFPNCTYYNKCGGPPSDNLWSNLLQLYYSSHDLI